MLIDWKENCNIRNQKDDNILYYYYYYYTLGLFEVCGYEMLR
jgi:hypothetical protein